MNLRAKVFLIFSILATVPLLILTLFSYQRYTQTIYQRMDDVSSRLFENAQEDANQTLASIRDTSYSFNFYYSDGSSLIEELKPYANPEQRPESYRYNETFRAMRNTCQSLLMSHSQIYGIYVFTPSGYIFDYQRGENGTVPMDHAFQEDEWYRATILLDGGFYISTVDDHPLFTGEKQSVFFAQCLKDVYTHKMVGVLLIDCDPVILDLSSVNTMPDITQIIIDNADTGVILSPLNAEEAPALKGKNLQVSRTDLALKPLRLTVTVDYDSLFREFNVTGMLMLLIGLICIAGLLIGAYFVSGYIVRPIEHLSRKMASQKGHTLIQSTRYLDRTDEIGTLYNEYNAMVESLNRAVKQDYHDKLVVLDAQMKSLEARINSHFLFNTLEAINSMAELDDNEDISTMSMALGNMFRYTLKTQSELVTVEDELKHVNDYVSIQQIRFDHRFSLIVDMAEDFRSLKVLKLILQPLVENALYHGLNYCSCGDTITITGHTEDGYIVIDVRDNGQGMSREVLEELQKSLNEEPSFTELGHRNKQSIGLKNIHSRIELYYGHGYGLTVTSRLREGTDVRIRVPLLQGTSDGEGQGGR